MKPLNLDNKPCSPISSNCVIWQGPDIECINLCNGDTVSDVVNDLATELCKVLTQINVSSYDLTCLGITAACPPENFEALIQLLITKICELESVPADTPTTKSGCPDCVVSVASCFVEGTATTMQLVDYVQAIASKVCSLVDSIIDLQNQIDSIDIRVTALENATPPTLTIPNIPTGCLQTVIPGSPATEAIDIVLDYLVNNADIGYCATINALYGSGTAADILAVVNPSCVTGASGSLLNPANTLSAEYPAWNAIPGNLAESLNNLWISICDLRDGMTTVQFTDTDTISFTQNAGLPNYDFSANLNQPKALQKATGSSITGGTPINGSSGLVLTAPGYVPSPVTAGGNGNAAILCANSFKLIPTTEFDTFAAPIMVGPGACTIQEDGLYDIGFSIRLSAPVTTPVPSAPDEGTPFGTGKGWYGGDTNSTSNNIVGFGIVAPGTGYATGLAEITPPSGNTVVVWVEASAGAVTGITILNDPGGHNEADLLAGGITIIQALSGNDAAARITGLTIATPKVSVVAGITVAGPACDTLCYDLFASNNSVARCDLESSRLGVQLTAGTVLELRLAILVNDEDPLNPGQPNPRWDYTAAYFDASDRAEWFFRKMGALLP